MTTMHNIERRRRRRSQSLVRAMRNCALSLFAAIVIILFAGAVRAAPDPFLTETRYCGQPARNADGSIKRRSAVVIAFKRTHPCPSTGLTFGSCPGWSADHVIPLAVCGCDAVSNMQWLKNEIKSCPGQVCKDRWERVVYACPNADGSPNASGLPLPAASAP